LIQLHNAVDATSNPLPELALTDWCLDRFHHYIGDLLRISLGSAKQLQHMVCQPIYAAVRTRARSVRSHLDIVEHCSRIGTRLHDHGVDALSCQLIAI